MLLSVPDVWEVLVVVTAMTGLNDTRSLIIAPLPPVVTRFISAIANPRPGPHIGQAHTRRQTLRVCRVGCVRQNAGGFLPNGGPLTPLQRYNELICGLFISNVA